MIKVFRKKSATPPETSDGFDEFGYPIQYRSASGAGLVAGMPKQGLIFYAPLAEDITVLVGPQFTTADTTGHLTFTTEDGIPCAHYNSTRSRVTNASILDSLGSAFTMSTWVRYDSSSSGILAIGEESAYRGAEISNYQGTFTFDQGTENSYTETHVTPAQWYHVCASVDGSVAKYYINGVLASTFSFGSFFNISGGEIVIGGYFGSSDNWSLIGCITAVRIYDRALSADEVLQLASEFTPTA